MQEIKLLGARTFTLDSILFTRLRIECNNKRSFVTFTTGACPALYAKLTLYRSTI